MRCGKLFRVFAVPHNRNLFDHIALFCLIDDVLSFKHFAENRMLAGEPRRRNDRDKKLAAVRIRSGICHGEEAACSKGVFVDDFIGKRIARSAGAVATRVAALNHKILIIAVSLADDAVKRESVVKGFAFRRIERTFGKPDEIHDGKRRIFVIQLKHDVSARRFHDGEYSVFPLNRFYAFFHRIASSVHDRNTAHCKR